MTNFADDLGTEDRGLAGGQGVAVYLDAFWRRKWRVLLGALLGLLGGGLLYSQSTPMYQSDAQVLVIPKRPEALAISGWDARMGPADAPDFLATHAALIKSPAIISAAVQKSDLASLPSFRGLGNPTHAIIAGLTVNRESKEAGSKSNDILYISFKDSDPVDCRVVLEAVVVAYKDFLDQKYRSISDETVKLISQAREVLAKELEKKDAEYKDFRTKGPVIVVKNKEGSSLPAERLLGIDLKRVGVLVRIAEIEARQKTLNEARKEGRPPKELLKLVANLAAATLHADEEQAGKPGATQPPSLADQSLPLLLEEQKLTQRYGKHHPEVKAVRNRIAETRRLLLEVIGPRAVTIAPDLLDGMSDEDALAAVQSYADSLDRALADLRAAADSLDRLFEGQDKEARAQIGYEVQDEAFHAGIARSQQLYDSVLKRLQEVDIVKDYGGYDAQTIAAPSRGTEVGPKTVTFGGAGLLVGLLAGLGAAYLSHLADRGFRTPEEVRRRLGLPVVGHIRVLRADEIGTTAAGAGLDPALCCYHRPKSPGAEAFRGVRTALYFSTGGAAHKVIQVTSPAMGDGKTTLAANLAVSIAQSGKKVLLIDADFRRPRLHAVFGLSVKTGMASVLAGEAGLDEAVQTTPVPGLLVLPCGPYPSNPAELLTSPRFKEALDELRQTYDYVLIDTPPVLAVTDPCVVAPRVDGVLLVIRISQNARPAAERAKEILGTLGANLLGVVVNAVDEPHGKGYGYGYGGYGYEDTSAENGAGDGELKPAGAEANGHPAAETVAGGRATTGRGKLRRTGLLRRFLRW